MAYRIAIAGALGPFVGPWIRSIGTEYAIDVNVAAVIEAEFPDNQIKMLDLPSQQQQQFPTGAVRYRIHIPQGDATLATARVHLR